MFKKSLLLMLLMTLLVPWAANAQNQLNEGFESATFPPEEWRTIHVSGTNSWARSTSQHHNGNASAYAHWATAGHNNYMITPQLEPQSGESLSFFVSAQSYSGTTLYVEVSTTTPEASAFSTTLATYTTGSSGTIGTTSTSTFVEKIIDVSSYAGQQIYIAFHIVDSNGGDIYIDDVTGVTLYVPACPKPTGLTATLTPGNGTIATLNWTAGGEETAWVLEYGTTSDFASATSVNVSGTPSKDLTGLNAETKYYARVKADCGGDYSDWCSTICEFKPTNALTVTVGDETATSSNAPIRNGSGSQSEFVYPASMLTDLNGKTLTSVKFYASTTSASYTNNVTVYMQEVTGTTESTSAWLYDQNTATKVFEGTTLAVSDGEMVITFSTPYEYAGGNLCFNVWAATSAPSVTWKGFNPGYASCGYDYSITPPVSSPYSTAQFLPKATFEYESNDYPKPKNLAVTNLTANSATITWESPSTEVTGYKYQYREAGGTWNTITSTTALSAPLSGLTGKTNYEFQVQAIYAGNESAFASTSFTTECGAYPIPYSYGFETEDDMDCWATLDCEVDGTYGLNGYLYGSSNDYAVGEAGGCFGFSSYNGATDPQYLFSPLLSGISEGLHVEFYYRSLQADDPEKFMVGYSTTDKDIDHFTWGNEITSPDANYNLFKANYPANTKYIAVKYTSGDSYYLFLDDFTFEEASSCLEPTNVTASGITTEEAIIDWTIGKEETEWDIYYTDDMTDVPDDSTTPIVEGTSTKPYTLDGLSDATTYYVYVRAVCGSSETSAWSTPCTFHTECYGLDMPMSTYSFEDGELSVCWNTYSDNIAYNRTSISDDEAHTGTYSLEFYRGSQIGDLIVTLPEVKHAYPIDWYQFDFWAMADVSDLIITIGIMEDPNDPTTFVAQGTGIEPESSFTEYKVRFNEYTGDGHYVAIMVTREGSTGRVYIDDVAIQVIPSCIEPEALNVSDETAHGATFEWTTGGSETEWHLYFSKENTAPADDINLKEVTVADSNPFTLTTGLDAETTYYVWVRANCGSTDGYSMWVGPETFTTTVACPAPTGLAASEITGHTAKLSWTGTSESYVLSVGTYDYTGTPVLGTIIEEGFEHSGSWPEGWTSIDEDGNGKGWYISSSAYNTGSYGAAAQYNSSAVPSDWLISPQIQFGGGSISFYARKSSGTEQFQVYVSTTGKDITDFTAISEVEDATTTYTKYEYDLSSYSGSGYVAIKHTGAIDQYWLYLDDITITGPTYPIAWDTYNTTDTQKTVEGLDPETQYFAKVKGNCGSEGYSQETAVISFTTDVACPAPTGFAIEAVGSNYVLLNWNLGVDDAWQVELTDVTHGSAPSVIDVNAVDVTVNEGVVTFQINLTNPENEYSVRLRANCESAGDDYSEWTSPLAFTTIAACSAMDVTFENITHHNVTVNWNGESDDDFTVYYRVAEQIDGISEDFSGTSVPSGWTVWSGLVDDVIDGSATLTTYNYGWSVVTSATNIFSSNHMKLNIYGSSVKYWLVTPEINLAANSGLSFDLALTAYASGGSGTSPVSGTNADDRFAVLIYANNAWTILREWNNSGSTYVYNDIATAGENVQIDLSSYTGTVKIAFYGESTVTVTGDDNDMHIDNVAIGVPVAAGDYQTQLVEGNTTNITSLTAGTKYEVRVVPNCNPSLGTEWTSFTTMSNDVTYFTTTGDWATASNWMDEVMPTATSTATIQADANVTTDDAIAQNVLLEGTSVVTVKNNGTLTINGTVTNVDDGSIIVEDGGQLIHNNSLSATVKKSISAYTAKDSNGWYLIATPDYSTETSVVAQGTYDLFKYNEPTAYWHSNTGTLGAFSTMYRNTGYLYANAADIELSFYSYLEGTNNALSVNLSYTSTLTDDVRGFNLLGNPFSRNLVEGDVKWGDETNIAYLTMNSARTDFTTVNISERPIQVGEAFFVQATAEGQSLEFNPTTAKSSNNGYIRIVAGNENGSDNAYINLANGNTIRKFNIANGTKVYVINEGQDFAAARVEELEGKIPVNFKAVADGEYTITISANNVEAHSMYLRDNFSGEIIDVLESPSYTFKATANDDEARFTLLFDFNNYTGIDENLTSDLFVYQYGNEIIVNGEGTLEVFDVMGRMVLNTKVNGVQKVNVPANNVYIFKLMGETVKTQKIVVR